MSVFSCDFDNDNFFDVEPVMPAAVGSGIEQLNRCALR